ncbi:MAG: transglutaminase-like domain-containing protein [Planctomycetia bacterium]|nr:transglutaminase-like domain-containing protein [Planctomycetia bacterium]
MRDFWGVAPGTPSAHGLPASYAPARKLQWSMGFQRRNQFQREAGFLWLSGNCDFLTTPMGDLMLASRTLLQRLAPVLICVLALRAAPASAQFVDEKPGAGSESRLRNPQKSRLQVGMVVRSTGGPLKGVFGTTPVPLQWDEQKVRVVNEERSPEVRGVEYRVVGETMKQLVVTIPNVPAHGTAKVMVTFEITKFDIAAPEKTDGLHIPKKVETSIRQYLGASPYIETRNVKIRDLGRKLLEGKESATDWQKVETLYDYVRDHVKYQNGQLKGALAALNDGTGDCEELSSLFIALCRVNGIPARTVWIPEHCYSEFYLVDDAGKGTWYPCQSAGARMFGSMTEKRPILQKGDNFHVPEVPKPQRYVAEFLKVKNAEGGQKPSVQFVRKTLAE